MTDLQDDAASLAATLASKVSADRLGAHVAELAAEPRGWLHGYEPMRRAQRYVTAELEQAGWTVQRDPFVVRWSFGTTDRPGTRAMPLKVRMHRRLTGVNLVATLPGTAPAAPSVVVGAHLDSVQGSPGADDNASGVAVLLETARVLAELDERAAVTMIVFDLEELGLIGSRVAARRLVRTRPVRGMICLESVGYYATTPGSQRLPGAMALAFPEAARAVRQRQHRGDFATVIHRKSSAAAAAAWSAAAAAADPALPSVTLRDPRPDGRLGAAIGLLIPVLNHLGRSDHASFWNRSVPSVMITDTANFRNEHYHRPSDHPDTVDSHRMAAVTTATAATALTWSRSAAQITGGRPGR